MDPDDVRALTDYLTKGIYPFGLNRDDKRSLRQKANSFMFSDGRLYHRGKEGRKQLVICNIEEKLRIIHAMHTEPGSRGGHNGMNTTIRKISEQYWWRRLVEDIRAFCKSCAVCSRLAVANQRPVYVAPVEWPEEFTSFSEPVYVSAPVIECTDMTSSSYATDLLRMLGSLYDQKICCDVVLSAGRFQTQAHKVVLIASSGFFKSLLLDKDLPFNDVITLSSVPGPCLELLISYLYTGVLRLNRDNVEQTLEAATYLDITSAMELCQRYLCQGEDGTGYQTLVLAPEEASEQALKLTDEKTIVKNDEEFAELELFIESHLAENRHLSEMTTSIKEEDDSGIVEKRVRVKKENISSSPESQKRLEQRTKDCPISCDTRKRKKIGEESVILGFDSCPQQKKPRGRPRKASEVVEQPSERRYATRSSTGVVVGRKRSRTDVIVHVTSRPDLRVKQKPLPAPLEVPMEKKSSAALSAAVLRSLLFSSGDRCKCAICSASFRLSTGLKLHCSVAHGFVLAREASCWLARKMVDRSVHARFTGICHETVTSNCYGSGDKAKFSCATCHASFALKSEAAVHRMRMHSTSYTCRAPHCFRQFRTCLKLLCHQRFKHGRGPRSKTTTPVVSVKLSPIARTAVVSRTLVDPFASEDVFSISNKCGWCGQTFASREQLLAHRQTVHRKPKVLESVVTKRRVQRDWSCKEKGCGLTFKTKDKLKAHMSETHPSVVFSCPECRFKTQVEQILLRHLVRRHRERHMCQLCGKAYHKPFLLRVHLFNRHKLSDPQLKLYHCQHEGCDYACPSKNGLNLHVLKHTSGSPFACSLCSKTFKRAVGLDKHISKIHLGIRPYICDKCGVSYGDESELKIHMTRHAENKPYACSYCDYSTFQKGNLKSHLFCRHQVLMDQEMLVMKCDQCSFTTDKKCRFHDHVKMHRNIRDIPCGECGKMFVTKKTLRQHIIKVHRQKNFTCPHCSYSTAVQSKLQEHIRSLHANQDPNLAVAFVDTLQLQLQPPHQQRIQMQNCVNGIVPSSLAVMHDYQTLKPMESMIDQQQQQQLGLTADAVSSSIVVRIPMSLDSGTYCFQTLDRSHLVM